MIGMIESLLDLRLVFVSPSIFVYELSLFLFFCFVLLLVRGHVVYHVVFLIVYVIFFLSL
jgi:hypothetical protein